MTKSDPCERSVERASYRIASHRIESQSKSKVEGQIKVEVPISTKPKKKELEKD